jgi:TRAP-type mannitol/chloroaromatic compound transport system permease small subunit
VTVPRWALGYIRIVDAVNRRIGRVAMYFIFAMMGVLLWSIITRQTASPAIWTIEMAQFLLVGYYMLGGPYAMQMGDHVRMDLLYAGWTPRRKSWFDAVTVLILIFYLGVLLFGGISSTTYAFATGETQTGLWRPFMWPVKLAATAGIVLMLLQASAEFLRDIARLRGVEAGRPLHHDPEFRG